MVLKVKFTTYEVLCLSSKNLLLLQRKMARTSHSDGVDYSKESVITAVNQGNQFGLILYQEIDYVYVSHMETKSEVVIVTTVRHVNDESTYVSKLPIILSSANYEYQQKIGSAITYAFCDIHCNQYMDYHQKMMM